MPKNNEIFSTANNSSCLKTPSGATTVSSHQKNTKNFAGNKNCCTFVPFNAKNNTQKVICGNFFTAKSSYANNTGYQIPIDYCNHLRVMVLGGTGGDSLFYIHSVTNQILS